MRIYREMNFSDFNFWGCALEKTKFFTVEDWEILDDVFNDSVMDATELNDLVAFGDDYIANILGYDSFDTLIDDREVK